MSSKANLIVDEDWSGADAALDRAFQRALELGRRTGTAVWVMKDGRLVNVLADVQDRDGGDSNGPRDGGGDPPPSA